MKSYNDCKLKRAIQHDLWASEPKHKTILGLSSPEVVECYLQALPKHETLILVNYESIDEAINCNSLVGMFDILLHRNIIPTFIDADFCSSIINSGDDLVYIYNKCKKLNRNITISFTFSIRGVGLQSTMNWLKEHFPEIHIGTKSLPMYKELDKRQFAYSFGAESIYYRDSGDQMFTGIIKINNGEI